MELRNTVKGFGVFATCEYAPGEKIGELKGAIIPEPTRFTVQVGPREHVDITGTVPSYLNHSCEPNGMIDVRVRPPVLRARRPIRANEEITFDYNTTEWDMAEPFECRCEAGENCRGVVRGLKHLSQEEQDRLRPDLSPAMLTMLEEQRRQQRHHQSPDLLASARESVPMPVPITEPVASV